ncbi:MAG: ABC transporter permease [Planctomycetota bacterium]|nr:ABC transporter permease [Planctomycetota bacterium]
MFKFATRNLMSRPMRSLLSLLGLSVAIAGMVGLFSVAEGLDRIVSSAFNRIPGLVAMQPGSPIPLFSSLPSSWEQDIQAVAGVSVVNPEVWTRVNAMDGKMVISPPRVLFGTKIQTRRRLKSDPYRDDLVAGRFLEEQDQGTWNVVVSRPIAKELNKGVGDTVRVNGQVMSIVGIYDCGSLLLDVTIILDIDQLRQLARVEPSSVSNFYIELDDGAESDSVSRAIAAVFVGRELEAWRSSSQNPFSDLMGQLDRLIKGRGNQTADSLHAKPHSAHSGTSVNGSTTPPSESPDPAAHTNGMLDIDERYPIEVRSASELAGRFDKLSQDLDLFLTILTAIGVTVAVLSIVNTMLMSVTERIIEFGILKANGWSKSDVLKLITFESGILGVGGGVLGCIAGWVGTQLVNNTWPDRIQLFASPGLLIFSMAFSTVLGVCGGLYPAIWAMRMMPMDAIRRG